MNRLVFFAAVCWLLVAVSQLVLMGERQSGWHLTAFIFATVLFVLTMAAASEARK